MKCDEVRELLDDYVDGELHGGERDSVARHLLECAACREEERSLLSLLAGAAALPRELPPARELWPGVRERLRPSLLAFPQTLPPFRPMTLAAAAALLVALSSAVTWRVARAPEAPLAASAGAPLASLVAYTLGAELLEAEREYARATSELLAAIQARRDSFAPETLVAVEQNMRAIDDALKSLREALASDPGNDELTQLLASTHKRKVDTLRRVVRLSRI
jgi:tetratricopeptide (TPR) repeat protein